MHVITRSAPLCEAIPASPGIWLGDALLRWKPQVIDAVLALMPCVCGALAGALANSFDWCYGGVRVTLAVCLTGASAAGTLLHCWGLDPASMRRAVGYAIASGLAAAVPLLLLG
jgi:uncharacterized membrane protein YeaQ/YmgE (transglycosylase-associated protein family)